MPKSYSLLRSGSALSLLTLISRVLGLLREMTKAALLGTGALSDAFSIAFMLPNLFRRLFAEGSIAVAFIPTFKEYLINDDYKQTREFLCCFWTLLSFLVSVVVAAGILAAPLIVPLFGIEVLDETILLTRIMFPFLLFISIAAFFQGILNSIKTFVPSAFAPILLNMAAIACAWLLSPYTQNPARAMAIGIFIGGFLEAAIQLPFVIKKGFTFFWTGLLKAAKNPGTKKVFFLICPTIIGMAAYQLNDLVSTMLAGNAGEGVVSSLQYSLRLQELILGVFAVSIGTVLLPELAEEAKRKNWSEYNKRLQDAISVIALITIPVIFFSLSQGEELIRLLFQTREFNETSVSLTLTAFTFHIAGLFFIALNRILAPAFYAQSDSLSPALAGMFSFVVNILLAFLLVDTMKGGGIALALSAAAAVNSLLLFCFLRKNKEIKVMLILYKSIAYTIKITAFSIIAVLPVHLMSKWMDIFFARFDIKNKLVLLAAPLAVYFIFFTLILLFLLNLSKDKYLRSFAAAVLGKIKKRPADGS